MISVLSERRFQRTGIFRRYYYYNLDDAIKDARAYKVNKYEISDQIEAFEALATDNIVLLKNCDMIGTSGINKGIVLDLNGYTVGSINPGVIPSDETLVITSYDKATITGAESVKDDENNTGVVYLDCAYLSIKGNINVGSHDICIHHKGKKVLKLIEGTGTVEYYPEAADAERARIAEQERLEEQQRLEEQRRLEEEEAKRQAEEQARKEAEAAKAAEIARANVPTWADDNLLFKDSSKAKYYIDNWGNWHITGPSGFAYFLYVYYNGETFEGKKVYLDTDVDMGYFPLQIIHPSESREDVFKGTFDGNNHTIYGLSMLSHDPATGLFTRIEGAWIEDLILAGPGCGNNSSTKGYDYMGRDYNNDNCGFIAGIAQGKESNIFNVHIKHDPWGQLECGTYIAGENNVGAIVGKVAEGGRLDLSVCTNELIVASCSENFGGMIGLVEAGATSYIRDCCNYGTIISTSELRIEPIAESDGTVVLEKNRHINSQYGTFGGGIVGASYGLICLNDCENHGNVYCDKRGDAGGIIAYINKQTTEKGYIIDCVNTGDVYGLDYAGGIVGDVGNNSDDQYYHIAQNSNSGEITAEQYDAGGIIGRLSTDATNHDIYGNSNSGAVHANSCAGGIIGYMEGGGNIKSSGNSGTITSNNNAGGIIGEVEDNACDFTYSKNSGSVIANNYAGGIAGYLGGCVKHLINHTENSGSIFSNYLHAGGLVGQMYLEDSKGSFEYCINYGEVNAQKHAGGLIAHINCKGKVSFSYCENHGSVKSRIGGTWYSAGLLGDILEYFSYDTEATFDHCISDATPEGGCKYCGATNTIKDSYYGASVFADADVWMLVSLAEILIFGIVIVILAVKLKKKGTKTPTQS